MKPPGRKGIGVFRGENKLFTDFGLDRIWRYVVHCQLCHNVVFLKWFFVSVEDREMTSLPKEQGLEKTVRGSMEMCGMSMRCHLGRGGPPM